MVEFKDEPCPCGISACAYPGCPQGLYERPENEAIKSARDLLLTARGGFRVSHMEKLMSTLLWIIRHPLYAASWYLTGEPYSTHFR